MKPSEITKLICLKTTPIMHLCTQCVITYTQIWILENENWGGHHWVILGDPGFMNTSLCRVHEWDHTLRWLHPNWMMRVKDSRISVFLKIATWLKITKPTPNIVPKTERIVRKGTRAWHILDQIWRSWITTVGAGVKNLRGIIFGGGRSSQYGRLPVGYRSGP